MVSRLLKRFLVLAFLFLLMQEAAAQTLGGGERRVYKKSHTDSVRLRSGVAKAKKESKKKVTKPAKKSREKSVAANGNKVDSLHYSARQYNFGERVIMRGDSGKDVRKLAEIMVNNLYIDERQIVYTPTGLVLYDGELVKAVMRFQELNGFYPDGMVGKKLVKVLKKL